MKPPNTLITTPETLQAILPGRRVREPLRTIKWVIVDEIHEISTNKRGAQLSNWLERLREITVSDFQRIGISATVGSPDLIAKFLDGEKRTVKIVKSVELKDFEVQVESPITTADDTKIAKRRSVGRKLSKEEEKKWVTAWRSCKFNINLRPSSYYCHGWKRCWTLYCNMNTQKTL